MLNGLHIPMQIKRLYILEHVDTGEVKIVTAAQYKFVAKRVWRVVGFKVSPDRRGQWTKACLKESESSR